MTAAKLVTNLPDGSGFTEKLVDKHYHDLMRGHQPEQVVVVAVVKAVEYGERFTANGRKRAVKFEHIACEPISEGSDLEAVRQILMRAQDERGATEASTLPLDWDEHDSKRREFIAAIEEWAKHQELDPHKAWFEYYDPAFEAPLKRASLTRLQEFAWHHGAAEPPPGVSDEAAARDPEEKDEAGARRSGRKAKDTDE